MKLIRFAKKNNAKIYLMIYPWPGQIYFESTKFSWEKFILQICKKNKCNGVINLFPKFIDEKKLNNNWYSKLYLTGDVHFNQYGNKLVAEEILRIIDKNSD